MRVQRTVAMASVVTMAMSVATGRRAPLSVTGDRARLSGVSPLPIRPFEIRKNMHEIDVSGCEMIVACINTQYRPHDDM